MMRSAYSLKPISDKLYLIQSGEYTKIGIAQDVESRLRSLQIGNPHRIYIENVYCLDDALDLETLFHHLYHHKRVKGEWYRLAKDEKMNIGRICKIYMSLRKDKRAEYVSGLRHQYKKERKGLKYGRV